MLQEAYQGHIIALIEEIHKSGKMLRDLANRSAVHRSRAPIVSNHLNVLLPCFSKSLRDIIACCDDKTIARPLRWQKMYHDMVKESGGMGPPQRFLTYNEFLAQLLFLVVRDRHFDPGQLSTLSATIADLRERQGLPAPVQSPTVNPSDPVAAAQEQLAVSSARHAPAGQNQVVLIAHPSDPVHWCEQVFSLPLSSRTDMGLADRSFAHGPFVPEGSQTTVVARHVFMRRTFDRGRICVKFIENDAANRAPWISVRLLSPGGVGQSYSYQGHHELCVRRDANSLVLMRWSRSARCAKDWLVLGFITWEGEFARGGIGTH